MKRASFSIVAALLGLVAALLTVGSASASHARVTLSVPEVTIAGDPANISATVLSAEGGAPLAGASVVFYTEAAFAGVSSLVELGRATTDASGVAMLTYVPKSEGDHEIRVEYTTPESSEPEVATITHRVAGASAQLHRSTSGIQVPGLNVWLLVGGVSAVWIILLSVAVRVIAIAHAGSVAGRAEPPPRAGSHAASLRAGKPSRP